MEPLAYALLDLNNILQLRQNHAVSLFMNSNVVFLRVLMGKSKLNMHLSLFVQRVGESGANWHPGRIGTPRVSTHVAVANLWR